VKAAAISILVVVAACLLAACGAEKAAQQGPESQPYDPRLSDIVWLRHFGRWERRLERDVGTAESLRASALEHGSSGAAFAAAADRLSTCTKRYSIDVGIPANTLWRGSAAVALSACRNYGRAEKLLLRSLDGSGTDSLVDGENRLEHADGALTRADSAFEKSFVWNRPLPRVGGVTSKSRIEPLFSRVGTAIANGPVQVRCWSGDDWQSVLAELQAWDPRDQEPAGFVGAAELTNRANLDEWTCHRLVRLAYAHDRPAHGDAELDLAWATQTLSHEIQHLVADGSEAETECYGMQELARVARGLGAKPAYARQLQLRFWRDGYPTDDATYYTRLCHDGGPLDANPSSSRWP
jgi:hypothetical protein